VTPAVGTDQRVRVKRALARMASRRQAAGLTVLIYHQVSGASPDERDIDPAAFAAQMDLLAAHRVVALDQALDELAVGDERPKVVITFDDGFADVHETALPVLAPATCRSRSISPPRTWAGSCTRRARRPSEPDGRCRGRRCAS